MFDRQDCDKKFQYMFQQKTAAHFGQTQDQSFVHEVEAQKQYVQRLKNQREKIQQLYSKYDVMLKDLKAKEVLIKEKDKTIYNLECKCKHLSVATQQSSLFKKQNQDIKTENYTLQKAISELEQSYSFLHGQFKSKEAVTYQKYQQMQLLNDELMNKLRSLNKRYVQREQEFTQKYKDLSNKLEESQASAKRQKQAHITEEELLKSTLIQRQEEVRLLTTENQCLKERVVEFEAYLNQLSYQFEEKCDNLQKEKKVQLRALKNQIQALRENNGIIEKKWLKLKQQTQLKELSLSQMSMIIQQHQKQNAETIFLLKQQFTQEKSLMKQQLLYCENHIAKLQRKIADNVRKQQNLYGKIKKYEICLDAKRNLREIEKDELNKINNLLNLP